MFCSNCGKLIDDESTFCIHCGKKNKHKINKNLSDDNSKNNDVVIENNDEKVCSKKFEKYYQDENIKVSSNFEKMSYDNGSSGYTVFFTIFNKSQTAINIVLINTSLIVDNIIKEKDGYYEGFYLSFDFDLPPNTGRKGSAIFYQYIKDFKKDDSFNLQFVDKTNSKGYNLFFKKQGNLPDLIFDSNKDLDKKYLSIYNLKPINDFKEEKKRLFNCINCFKKIEESIGISYENITIDFKEFNEDYELVIMGNIIEVDRKKLDKYYNIETIITLYDKEGHIIETKNVDFLDTKNFLEIQSFSADFGTLDFKSISKIDIFPRKYS